VLHPEWDPLNLKKFHADIAIIFLPEEVSLTNFIYPACLPPLGLQNYSGDGTIAGWGKKESSLAAPSSNVPRYVEIQTEDASFCYTNDSAVADLSSHDAFCAGGKAKGKGPCR